MSDGSRQIMRSTINWHAPVSGDRPRATRRERKKHSSPRRHDLTPEQEREALELVALRETLTDAALAKRYGLTYGRFCRELRFLRMGK